MSRKQIENTKLTRKIRKNKQKRKNIRRDSDENNREEIKTNAQSNNTMQQATSKMDMDIRMHRAP